MGWARHYSACIECGRTDREHFGRGLCSYCYMVDYQSDPIIKARMDIQKHAYYLRCKAAGLPKIDREERYYDGRREPVMQRDGYKCTRCGETDRSKLVVHHRDGRGRGTSDPNNDDENLETVCRACHARHHSTTPGWTRQHASCTECGRTDRKHAARGLCCACSGKRKYHAKYPMAKYR